MMSPRAAAIQGSKRLKKYRKAARKRSIQGQTLQDKERESFEKRVDSWYIRPPLSQQ